MRFFLLITCFLFSTSFAFLEEFVYWGEPSMFRYEFEELKKCSNGKLMLFEHFFISSYLLKE
jgi:hypothetical protein